MSNATVSHFCVYLNNCWAYLYNHLLVPRLYFVVEDYLTHWHSIWNIQAHTLYSIWLNVFWVRFHDLWLLHTGWLLFLAFPLTLIFCASCLAETTRTPFDFTEGESELVSGFNTEWWVHYKTIVILEQLDRFWIWLILTSITGEELNKWQRLWKSPLSTHCLPSHVYKIRFGNASPFHSRDLQILSCASPH